MDYTKISLNNIISVTYIISMYYYEFEKSYKMSEAECHDFWEIMYVDKGEAVIQSDNEEFVIHQGELFLHKPNAIHLIKGNQKNNFNVFILSFFSNSKCLFSLSHHIIKVTPDIHKTFTKIAKECNHAFFIPLYDESVPIIKEKENIPLGSKQLVRSYIEQLCILLLRNEENNKITNSFQIMSLLNSDGISNQSIPSFIKSYLKEHVYDNISISDVCFQTNYSKTYISTAFKSETGFSIIEYYNKIKIEKAKDLIRENELSLVQISEKLGFASIGYFCKVFKKVTKTTPNKYKNTIRMLLNQ